MTRTRPILVLLGVATTLMVLAAACGSSGGSKSNAAPKNTVVKSGGKATSTTSPNVTTPAGKPKYGGSVTYAVEGESDGWLPSTARWTEPATTEAFTVFDTLAAWGPNYDAEPYLASAFTHNADYTVWDIHLRTGITFHDGEKLDAAAVKLNLDTLKASALTSSSFTPVVSFNVVSPTDVAVHMSSPWSVFPIALTGQVGAMAAPKQIAAGDSQHPIGTGPFTFSSWTVNSAFVVKKNPHYWRTGLPYLDQVTFKPITEGDTMYAALLSGDVDIMESSSGILQPKMVSSAKQGQMQIIYSSGETEENMTMLNTSAPPFNDLAVRQALAYGTDTKTWAKLIGISPNRLADGPFAPGSKWYIPTGYPKFDLAKAKALVQQYEATHGPLRFTLNCSTDPLALQTCQVLQSQWKTIGADVSVKTYAEAALISQALAGSYQATIWRLFGAQDPNYDSIWWNGANTKPPLALNMARNDDPIINQALLVGQEDHIEAERQLAFITLARRLAIDLPYIWLDHTEWLVGARNNVHGWDATTLPDGTKTDPVISGIQRMTQIWIG